MNPFVFFILLSFANFCCARPYYYVSRELGWNVTNDSYDVLSNGRRYFATGLGFRNFEVSTNTTIKHRVVFLSNEGDEDYKLSVVAWDDGVEDIVDVVWQVNNTVGMNATLKLQEDGNLVLLRQDGNLVWQTDTAAQEVTQLWLTDYGALELINATNSTVWSSFKHPTNKLLCGQVLEQGLHLENGNYRFSSEAAKATLYYIGQPYRMWEISSLTDNVTADSYVVFCCDSNQAILQLRSDIKNVSLERNYFKSNWDGCQTTTSNTPLIDLQISYDNTDVTYVAVATLGEDGILTAEKLSVKSSIFQGNDSCNLPNICGSYGLCNANNNCTCPLDSSYFKPVDSSNSASGCEFSNGYRETGKCHMRNQNEIGYYEIQFVQANKTGDSEDACYNTCLESSTCRVAFYQTESKSCFLVSDNISSLIKTNGTAGSFKVCRKDYSRIITIASAAGGSCLVLLIIGIIIYIKMTKVDEGEDDDGAVSSCLSESTLKRFSLKELGQLTSGFSEKLGNGAFGTVYKGQLTSGSAIAVKCLNGSTQEAKDFYAELSVLSRVRHYNLVQLLGFCSNKKSRALVYEFMGNGSLDQWLMGDKPFPLKWEIRMEIAIGSAKGLAYLHEGCAERVLHLDVKPQNILLDEHFCPKVADFGLSRLMNREENALFMTNICGTPGYLAPELIRGEGIDVKTDVYSFGVVLVELFAGKKPMEPRAEQIWNLSKDNKAIYNSADLRLGGSFNLEEARRMLKVAALCVHFDPEARPHMSSVVQMLEGLIDIPQIISTPMFYRNLSGDVNIKFMKLLESRASSSSNPTSSSTSSTMPFLAPR